MSASSFLIAVFPVLVLTLQFICSTHPESGSIDKFVDGSMEADLPMQQISELFNINHFIVSQVGDEARILGGKCRCMGTLLSPPPPPGHKVVSGYLDQTAVFF